MSLTRAEWRIMWSCVRRIEKYIESRSLPRTEEGKKDRASAKTDIDTIKEQIQSVVGQLD
jgi:hypothetical protein